MSIGEFARLSRLSPKALRLYDELGLLEPARVDDDSGYRYYSASQLDRGWLIAALRQLQMPLAEIKLIVSLEPDAAAARIAAHWNVTESEHAARRDLARYLIDYLEGKRHVMYEVATRDIPARRVLSVKRSVEGTDGAWAFGKEFISILRNHALPRMEGRAGASYCIFWGAVSDDSDGPMEWCRPVPTDQAEQLAVQVPELVLRDEPAHREAFVHLGPGPHTDPAQWQLVSLSLRSWAEEHKVLPNLLGTRITYLADATTPAGQGPDCDFAIPFNRPTPRPATRSSSTASARPGSLPASVARSRSDALQRQDRSVRFGCRSQRHRRPDRPQTWRRDMPHILVYHDVDDVQHWLTSSKREEVFGPLGVTNIRTFIDPEGSNRVGLTMDVPDMDAVMAMVQTKEGADAMAHDGVHPDSMVILIAS